MTTLHILDDKLWFPPAADADQDGLLAAGGDVQPDRLLMAYRLGIFPWYSGDIPLWWCPDPRFVIYPEWFYVSKSLKQVMRRQAFHFTTNTCFTRVMQACQLTPRQDQDGTWINAELIQSFTQLHHMGFAYSFEAWQHNELVGGLYGLRIGSVFFGESMFSRVSNASKAAFVYAVETMQAQGLSLIDCQVHTSHLATFGARFIPRQQFLQHLQQHLPA